MDNKDYQYISNQFSDKKQYFNRGTFIYIPQQSVKKVFLVREGIVKIGYYNNRNDSITKAILYKGDIFNMCRLIQNETSENYAEVISTTAEISTMNSSDFWRKIKMDVDFQYHVLNSLNHRIIDLEKRWMWVSSLSIEKRIIAFIVDMGVKTGIKVGFDTMIENPFTHLEIGKFIGSSRQTVTTVFNQLQAKNLIYYNRKKILIRDLKKLQLSLDD